MLQDTVKEYISRMTPEGEWSPYVILKGKGHSSTVTFIAFSHDGTKIASGSWDYTICVWDSTTGAHLATLKGHTVVVTSVAFSRDGTKLASGSWDSTVRIWDPTAGTHLITLGRHPAYVVSVVFSHDGTRLASGCSDDTIYIWDPTTGVHLFTLKGYPSSQLSIVFSSHSSIVFSHDGTHIKVRASSTASMATWDLPTISDPGNVIYPRITDTSESSPFVDGSNEQLELYFGYIDPWLCARHSQDERRRVCYFPHDFGLYIREVVQHERCLVIGCGDGRILILDFSRVDMCE